MDDDDEIWILVINLGKGEKSEEVSVNAGGAARGAEDDSSGEDEDGDNAGNVAGGAVGGVTTKSKKIKKIMN